MNEYSLAKVQLIKIKKRKRYCFTHGNVIYESCG